MWNSTPPTFSGMLPCHTSLSSLETPPREFGAGNEIERIGIWERESHAIAVRGVVRSLAVSTALIALNDQSLICTDSNYGEPASYKEDQSR